MPSAARVRSRLNEPPGPPTRPVAAPSGRNAGGLRHSGDRHPQVVNIDPKTLRKYYRAELDFGETKANAQVAGFLFNSARNGNVTAQIFWLKTRARWREVPAEHKHSGAVGSYDLTKLTDEELERLIATLDGAIARS